MTITRSTILKARLTPREELVMNMLADGISVSDIIKTGQIVALVGRKHPLGKHQIYNIKNRAIRKILAKTPVTH